MSQRSHSQPLTNAFTYPRAPQHQTSCLNQSNQTPSVMQQPGQSILSDQLQQYQNQLQQHQHNINVQTSFPQYAQRMQNMRSAPNIASQVAEFSPMAHMHQSNYMNMPGRSNMASTSILPQQIPQNLPQQVPSNIQPQYAHYSPQAQLTPEYTGSPMDPNQQWKLSWPSGPQ